MQMGLIFGRESQPIYGLIGYVNNNFAEDSEDRKLVMDYYFFLNGVIISWCRQKQRIVSTSMIEAEYIAHDHAVKEVVWIWKIVNKMGLEVENIILHDDNKMSINLTMNVESQHCTKYIDV